MQQKNNISGIVWCVLVLCLPSYTAHAGWWEKIKESHIATTTVNKKTESFCRDMLKEAGVSSVESIPIISSSITGIGDGPRLYIEEEWLNTLPNNEKRFVLGHEAIHIKNSHVPKLIASIYVLLGLQFPIHYYFSLGYEEITEQITNETCKKVLQSTAMRVLSHALLHVITFWLPFIGIKWATELEATREGALALNCVEGGLDYLNGIKPTSFWNSLVSLFHHPPTSWHIAALQNLKQ